jgi:DNA-binding transcriptional regulator LsrR (DeoR family)
MMIAESEAKRPPIPTEGGHRFRSKAASQSERRRPTRKIREVLRLKYACGASDRVISRSVGIGRTAIAEYVRRAAVIGITWPIPEELDDTALERK